MLTTAKPSETLQDYKQQRAIETEKARTQINRFIRHSKRTGCSAMYYLHALFNYSKTGVNEGAFELEGLTEDLIRHFAQPEQITAWIEDGNDPKRLMNWLLQMRWFFSEMQDAFPQAYLHRYGLKHHASEEEIAALTKQYTEQADMAAAAAKAYKKHNAQAA